MSLLSKTGGGYFKAHNAVIVGDVTIGQLSSFWFNVTVRGDVAPVRLGKMVNAQDGVVIHCDSGQTQVIEDGVSIGHRAVVHGAHVGAGTLVGMGALVLGGAKIGRQCLIAAGAVVPPGLEVPDRSVVMGVPGRIVRMVSDDEIKYLKWVAEHYVRLAEKHIAGEFSEHR